MGDPIDRSELMSLVTAETENVQTDLYLFFLITARPSATKSLKATPGKLEKSTSYVVTCEALRLRVIAPSLEEGFSTMILDIEGMFSSRSPAAMTKHLLENGQLGHGLPADGVDVKTGALQTILNMDPDITYRMAHVRVTVELPKAVTIEGVRQ